MEKKHGEKGTMRKRHFMNLPLPPGTKKRYRESCYHISEVA